MQNVKKTYNLFLDDIRTPQDAFGYTGKKMFVTELWEIVRNFNEFVYCIEHNWEESQTFPSIISFDHDLADEHYGEDVNNDFKEYTGKDCANWLCNYCMDKDIRLCSYYCHSMNPVGRENIVSLLDNFNLLQENEINFEKNS